MRPIEAPDQLRARLTQLITDLPPADGIACFCRMYLLVTDGVQQHLGRDTFQDPAWITRLDTVFGNLFLQVVAQPANAPKAWAALIERRADPRITPLQFALAGMNAHINRDLPLAVVTTSAVLHTTPQAGSHAADYQRVDDVLAEVEPTVRRTIQDQLLNDVDRTLPGLTDIVANFNIVKARAGAWQHAEAIWALRQVSPKIEADFLDGLDHLVGLAGRGLLAPLRPVP